MRDRQHNVFLKLLRRAGLRASHASSHVHVVLDVALVVALVCGQSGDCRVPRGVPNPARDGVFCTYLSDREQSVNIENTISEPAPVKCWVPQGSIDDISLDEHLSDICLFANDVVII